MTVHHIADLVLGTMYFGTRTSEADSFALLDRFVEAGGRTLDTANCYAFWTSETGVGGQSEAVIGRWLDQNPGVRDSLVIATKVGQEPIPGERDKVEGLSAKVIATQCQASLERLRVDQVDVHFAHGEDRRTPLEETVAAFGRLVAEQKVRRLGVSNHPAWRIERARRLAQDQGVESWSVVQPTTSYVHPRPLAEVPGKDHRFGFLTDELIDYVVTEGLEVWAYSPLIQGGYDRADRPLPEAYDHPGTTRRLAALGQVAQRHGAAASQVVLAWLLRQDPVVRPIVGVSTPEQLDAALAAALLELSPEDLSVLDTAR